MSDPTLPLPDETRPEAETGPVPQAPTGPLTVLPRLEPGPHGPVVTRARLPRFEVRATLGSGGMGEVLEVEDRDIGRTVAVKRMKAGAADTGALLRFADEVRTVGRLEHPNVVPVHDVGLDEDGRPLLVMKRIRGETLDAIIRRLQAGDAATHAAWPFERRVEAFRGILNAVAFAHAHGVLHRDLKPANVMVGDTGEVVVLDWGLACPLGTAAAPAEEAISGDRISQTRAGSVVGTPAYMSPEQVRGEPLDARSDVYSLCVLFHEFLGLRHYLAERPDEAAAMQGVLEVEAPILRLHRHPAQPVVPMDLLWFVARGLRKDPARRYPTVRDLLAALDERARGRIPIRCHVTFSMRLAREVEGLVARHPIATAGAWALLVAALAVALLR